MFYFIVEGGWPRFEFFYPSTISAAPAFVLFESWEPLTYPSGDVPRRPHGSVGRGKSVAQTPVVPNFPTVRKAGAASVSMVTAKLGQPPSTFRLVGTHWIRPGKTTRCEKGLRENHKGTSPRRQARTT